jgi:hypothetical protein
MRSVVSNLRGGLGSMGRPFFGETRRTPHVRFGSKADIHAHSITSSARNSSGNLAIFAAIRRASVFNNRALYGAGAIAYDGSSKIQCYYRCYPADNRGCAL